MDFVENLTQKQINLFAAIGNWVAAFATVATAIVAIWLARYPHKAKLKIEAGYALLTSDRRSMIEGFRINIVNMSTRTVVINNIKLLKDEGRKKNWVFIHHGEDVRIIESEHDVQITITQDYHNWKQKLINDLKLVDDESLETLRLQITTSTGYTKKVKLNEHFIDDLRHEIEMIEIERDKTQKVL